MKDVFKNCAIALEELRGVAEAKQKIIVDRGKEKYKKHDKYERIIGSVVYVDRFVFRHYGVCINEYEIIHFGPIDIMDFSTGKVVKSSYEEFAGNSYIKVCNRCDSAEKYSLSTIIKRAEKHLGSDFGGYSLTDNNCEHFARWCVTGEKTSNQVFMKNDSLNVVEKAIEKAGEPVFDAIDRLEDKTDRLFEKMNDVNEKIFEIKQNIDYASLRVKWGLKDWWRT